MPLRYAPFEFSVPGKEAITHLSDVRQPLLHGIVQESSWKVYYAVLLSIIKEQLCVAEMP